MSLFFDGYKNICCCGRIVLELDTDNQAGVYDTIEVVDENLIRWQRELRKKEVLYRDIQNVVMSLKLAQPAQFYMIPGVDYNGNHWGTGKEPKDISVDGKMWRFAYHRSGIPAGMFCQTEGWAVGMWGDIGNRQGFSCGFYKDPDQKMRMNIFFPEQEGPKYYCARDVYCENEYCETTADSDISLKYTVYIYVKKAEELFDYGGLLDRVWEMYKREKKACADSGNIWKLGITFLEESAFFEQNDFTGFCMGLTWNGKKWVQKRDYLEIGWVGANASAAVSLICNGIFTDKKSYIEQGIKVLDCWVKGRMENGLFRCRYDLMEKNRNSIDNSEEIQDAANLYSAVEEYLEAYEILKRIGIKKEYYRELALGICDFSVQIQEESGRMGKAWLNNGTCIDREGSIGCYLVLALCRGYCATHEKRYFEAAVKGFTFYYEEFIRNGFTTAGALDTYCIDKESALPILKTAVCLYEETENPEYLEKAVKISTYIATWQYHYDISFPGNSILGKMDYKTRGGTSVSVQHHHIDCYGLFIYEDWKKLALYTKNPVWKERAEAIWENSTQLISDGCLTIKGQIRPKGSQDEGVLQTRWHTKKGEFFGVSEWLVVWNTAFRLKILRKEYMSNTRKNSKIQERIC